MKNILLVAGLFVAGALAQRIGVDGVTKTIETHRVDLSQCDTVRIEGPIEKLNASDGKFSIYMFKRYGFETLITCEVKTTSKAVTHGDKSPAVTGSGNTITIK